MLITTQLYWSMLEMGLSLIAACLPTMRPLFGDKSKDRFFTSVRSFFLLRSLSSSFSWRKTPREASKDYKDFSNASDARLVHASQYHVGVETHAMRDIESQIDVPPGRILTHTGFLSRSSSH